MAGLQGYVESLTREHVAGWVWNPEKPDERLSVELLLDGLPVAAVLADASRPDLTHFHAEPNFGFTLPVPAGLLVDRERVAVRIQGSDVELPQWEGAPHYEGRVEMVTERSVSGWAWRIGYPRVRVTVIIRNGEQVIGRVRAERFRRDLYDAGVGDGYCSFQFDLEALGDRVVLNRDALRIEFEEGGAELQWLQPRQAQSGPAPNTVAAPSPPSIPAVAAPVPAAIPAPVVPAPPPEPAAPPAKRMDLSPELVESLRGSIALGGEDSLF